jgi:hypothetical protein
MTPVIRADLGRHILEAKYIFLFAALSIKKAGNSFFHGLFKKDLSVNIPKFALPCNSPGNGLN